MSLLNQLISITSRSKKRVGRGSGSGKGSHTAGRGVKGQRSRAGGKVALWFEGGQLPLIKRLPMMRGKLRFKIVRPTAEITLTDLEKMKADQITLETLKLEKVIEPAYKAAKIILAGDLKRNITVQSTSQLRVTAGAAKAIAQAGGKVEAEKSA